MTKDWPVMGQTILFRGLPSVLSGLRIDNGVSRQRGLGAPRRRGRPPHMDGAILQTFEGDRTLGHCRSSVVRIHDQRVSDDLVAKVPAEIHGRSHVDLASAKQPA